MADKFVTAYARAKKAEERVNAIFAIKQSPVEGLRDFLSRFNCVKMTLPNVLEGIAVAVFQNGLSRNGSRATRKSKLTHEIPPISWDEIHNAYCAEVRADEDGLNGPTQWLTSVQMESRKDRINDNRRDHAGPPPNRERNNLYPGEARPKSEVAAKDEVRPKRQKVKCPLRIPPGTRSQDRGLHHFKARGREHTPQRAFERFDERPRKGKLCSKTRTTSGSAEATLPSRSIQMIIEGGDDASFINVKFTTTHKLKRSITHEWYDDLEESIIFDESDTHSLTFPHYDALVITLRISDTGIKRIMVDDGSGACIIHPRVVAQIRLEDRIVPRCITLTGFNNAFERTSGEITLLVLAGGITLETTFHIMDQDTVYNAIIGRPWIHLMRAIPSSLYQVVKFLTPWGVFNICGGDEGKDVIKDPKVVDATGSTVEDLDLVQLDQNDHSKKAYIGHKLQEPSKFHQFLANNADLFAFSHAEMSDIPNEIATHKLNANPFYPPLWQVRRKFNAAINDVVREEVEKLLENGSIIKSKYPQWVANVVMVKKKNGK
uniref:Uncharacterized protein n=1 Tax=Nicotiana tabacum TaxID=4097 RepID=A0A1S4DG44_TOBAC|nr:PREDICTED: uncharacterized protein LOC107829270 [Nicotiana tabacum]